MEKEPKSSDDEPLSDLHIGRIKLKMRGTLWHNFDFNICD